MLESSGKISDLDLSDFPRLSIVKGILSRRGTIST